MGGGRRNRREGRGRDRDRRGRGREERDRSTSIAVGATANKAEIIETVPIAAAPGGARTVALSFGPGTKTDNPLPDLSGGDRLLAFAELELTTDAEDPRHPGRIGDAYSYAPKVEATLLLAADPQATAAEPGRAIQLGHPWRRAVSHQLHHAVVTFGDVELRLPREGLPWSAESYVNLVVDASHPDASSGAVLLVGQNEKTPTVVQDMAGIRTVRFRPGNAAEPAHELSSGCLCAGVPVAKRPTVVLTHELDDLAAGEQLLVRGKLVTDAGRLPGPARISTRLFLADAPDQTEPGGVAGASMSWKGHLSKFTGFNCIPADGPQTSSKYGVATVRQAPGRPLYVNFVAVSAAPFGRIDATAELPIDVTASELAVTRLGSA